MRALDATTTPPPRDDRGGGVYVHVPFCGSLCSYCRFARTDRHDRDLRAAYVDGVLAELDLRRARSSVLREGRRPVRTLYVGGGTPTVLDHDLAARLMDGLRARLPLAGDAEITVEANPESFDAAAAAAWADAGVNRVSLGVQSLAPAVLATLGRRADPAAARRALATAAGRFGRVSADWILAPGCRPDVLAEEFATAAAAGVEHVSFYILEWHAGTPLTRRAEAGLTAREPDGRIEAVYLAAVAALADLGYRQYEISNFSLPGAESRHNRAYWERRPYLGLGPSAHGFWGARRGANHEELDDWLADVRAGRIPEAFHERLTPAARRLERLVLGLRTREGAPRAACDRSDASLARGEAEGLWRRRGDRLLLTPRGLLRIDAVEEFLAGDDGPSS